MKLTKLVAIFLIATVVFIIYKCPVGLILANIELPKHIAYQGIQGTIWQGEIKQLQVDKWQLGNVRWQFKGNELLSGRIDYQFSFGQPRQIQSLSGKGQVSFNHQEVTLKKATFRAPAQAMAAYMPVPMSGLSGRLVLELANYNNAFDDKLCEQLQGELIWTKAGFGMTEAVYLGTLTSELSCLQRQIIADFTDDNLLGLQGQAQISAANKYNFDGYLKPDARLPKSIHQGIAMFSKPDSQGRYKIKL